MTRHLTLLLAAVTGIACCLAHTATAQVSPTAPPQIPPTMNVPPLRTMDAQLPPVISGTGQNGQGNGTPARIQDNHEEVPVGEVTLEPIHVGEDLSSTDSREQDCDCPECSPRTGIAGAWGRFKARMQSSHWGYCEYFHERPFGSLYRAHMQTQIVNAALEKMVLYQYDFFDGTDLPADRLNPRGKEQLKMIVQLVEQTGQPLTVERTGNAALDEARRQNVVRRIREDFGYPATAETVFVGKPAAFGLIKGGVVGRRTEPAANFYNLLEQTQQRGDIRLRSTSGAIRR